MSGWIVVRNWEKFQHYGEQRNPVWIKDYVEQTGADDWRGLTFATRGVLQGLRLEYARSRRRLPHDTADLSRRLGGHVTKFHIESLVQAGFIRITASAPSQRRAMPEKRREEKKTPLPPSGNNKPNLKGAKAWAKNGLLAEVPERARRRVLMDEFHITEEQAESLVNSK